MTVVDGIAVRRVVTGPIAENCYLVSSGRGDAVVIDPGDDAEAIGEWVTADGLRVHAVLGTHGHHDHVGAVGEMVDRYGVPFGIHPGDSDSLRRVSFYRFACHRLGPVAIPPIGIDLETDTALRFADLEVSVIHTPGHSPGSVCFEIAGELFTGDTLPTAGPGGADIPGSDAATLEASVRLLARAYPPETTIHPGHGRSATLGDALIGALARPEPGR